MKKKFLIFLFSLSISSLFAQDIVSVFLSTPDDILFGLDAESRDKLVANVHDSAAIVTSGLNAPIKRTAMSDDFIALQTSSAGSLQIKLLPLINNSKIVCVVKTVCGKACDSSVRFYSADWKPLENASSLFPKLNSDSFIQPNTDRTSESFINAFAALDMTPIKVFLNAENTSAKVILDIENYLSKTDYDKLKPYLIEEPKVFNWDKTSFK